MYNFTFIFSTYDVMKKNSYFPVWYIKHQFDGFNCHVIDYGDTIHCKIKHKSNNVTTLHRILVKLGCHVRIIVNGKQIQFSETTDL